MAFLCKQRVTVLESCVTGWWHKLCTPPHCRCVYYRLGSYFLGKSRYNPINLLQQQKGSMRLNCGASKNISLVVWAIEPKKQRASIAFEKALLQSMQLVQKSAYEVLHWACIQVSHPLSPPSRLAICHNFEVDRQWKLL